MANATWDLSQFGGGGSINLHNKASLLSSTRVGTGRSHPNNTGNNALLRVRSSDGIECGLGHRIGSSHHIRHRPTQQQRQSNDLLGGGSSSNHHNSQWNHSAAKPMLSSKEGTTIRTMTTSNNSVPQKITDEMIMEEMIKRRYDKKTYTEPFMEAEYDLHAKLMSKRFCNGNIGGDNNDSSQQNGDTIFQFGDQIEYAIQNYLDSVGQYYIEYVAATNIIPYEEFWLRYFYRCSYDTIRRELDEKQLLKLGKRGSPTSTITNISSSIDLTTLGSGIRDAISKSMSGFSLNQLQNQQPQQPYDMTKKNSSSSLHMSRRSSLSALSSSTTTTTTSSSVQRVSSGKSLLPLSSSKNNLNSLSNHQRRIPSRQSSGRRLQATRSSDELIAEMMMISVDDLNDFSEQ